MLGSKSFGSLLGSNPRGNLLGSKPGGSWLLPGMGVVVEGVWLEFVSPLVLVPSSLVAVPLAITFAVLRECTPSLSVLASPTHWLYLAGIFVLTLPCGFLVAILFGWFVLGPYYMIRAKINGAPFEVGDRVRILAGPHRDRIATVYEVWESREQVRVELGEAAKVAVTDLFSEIAVCQALDD